jgi:uncharacterized membrane protein
MDFTILKSTVIINRPIHTVWDAVKLPGDIKNFHPLIKESYMISDEQYGKGAKRYCQLKPMGVMEELISEWKEGEMIETEVVGGKMLPPYSFMRGILNLKSRNEDQTEVSFTFSYKLKFGTLGMVLDKLLIRPQFRSAPLKYTSGLKSYLENGAAF